MQKILCVIVSLLMIVTVVPVMTTAPAQGKQAARWIDWNEVGNLHPTDAQGGQIFGHDVAIDGDTAIIGAQGDHEQGTNAGAAYVFTQTAGNWSQEAKLTDTDGGVQLYFGWSVAISGDTVLVGETGENSGAGAAYVFTRTGTDWTQQAKLVADDQAPQDELGYALALEQDTAVIGAPNDDTGSVYIFTRDGTDWSQSAKLTPSDGETGDGFGCAVAVSPDTILVGSAGALNLQGAVYVYVLNGSAWVQQAKLTASDGESDDSLGTSVALDGDTALLGAPSDNDLGVDSGSAYIFTRTDGIWTQGAKLHASDGFIYDFFSSHIALDNGIALISSPFSDGAGFSAGSAYFFTKVGDNWTQEQELFASDPHENDWFGEGVAMQGNTALIGADGSDAYGAESGLVYIFTGNTPPVAYYTWTPAMPNPGQTVTFNASASYDPDGTITSYAWDWNSDGIYDAEGLVATHTWTDGGVYPVTLRVIDNVGSNSTFTQSIIINRPPNTPTIDGASRGKAGTPYIYTAKATDNENNMIRYCFNWSDGTADTWVGPSPSGADATANHIWAKRGSYTVRVRAEDEYNATSDWASLPIKMPYQPPRPLLQLLEEILQHYPNAFPLLRHILG